MKKVYLDNGAATMVDPKVVEAMLPYFTEKYGNASSLHRMGREAKEGMDKARRQIASILGTRPNEIIFTSGGTESNNIALKSIAFTNRDKGNHIITTKVEHKCVMNASKWLETQGFKVTYLDVDNEGFVKSETLENAITNKTLLVSIIHGNNEIGTIQDLDTLGKICHDHSVPLHIDACQSFTRTDLDTGKHPVDLITINSQKIHGPKGCGALYVREGTNLGPWQHGGGHEFGIRSSTENISGIVGFGEAAMLGNRQEYVTQMSKRRDKLIDGVLEIPDVLLNGPRGDKRLCNNTNFSFLGIEGEALGGYLDQKGICSSTASACSEKTLEPSYVLTSIGRSVEEANGSLRTILSRFTTEEEIDYVLEVMPGIVKKLRRFSPLAKVSEYVGKKL